MCYVNVSVWVCDRCGKQLRPAFDYLHAYGFGQHCDDPGCTGTRENPATVHPFICSNCRLTNDNVDPALFMFPRDARVVTNGGGPSTVTGQTGARYEIDDEEDLVMAPYQTLRRTLTNDTHINRNRNSQSQASGDSGARPAQTPGIHGHNPSVSSQGSGSTGRQDSIVSSHRGSIFLPRHDEEGGEVPASEIRARYTQRQEMLEEQYRERERSRQENDEQRN